MLLTGTCKNQIEIFNKWLKEWQKPLLLITGPTASGKTTLWIQITTLEHKNVKELSGFSKNLFKHLNRLRYVKTVKTIAEYVNIPYVRKPDILVIEDVEMADIQSQRAILDFAKAKIMPVVCVSLDLPEKIILDAAIHIRMQKPPLDLIVREITSYSHLDVKELVKSCNCDLRQVMIEMDMLRYSYGTLSFCDKTSLGPFELVSKLFTFAFELNSFTNTTSFRKINDNIIPLMIAENYCNVKNLDIHKAAKIADAISDGDCLKYAEEDMRVLYQVITPCSYAIAPLTSRPLYPILPAKIAAELSNKKRLPCKYDLLQPMETRIVKTLVWAPPSIVAKEMQSLHITKMEDWETVHILAPIGRPPVNISQAKKDELSKYLPFCC